MKQRNYIYEELFIISFQISVKKNDSNFFPHFQLNGRSVFPPPGPVILHCNSCPHCSTADGVGGVTLQRAGTEPYSSLFPEACRGPGVEEKVASAYGMNERKEGRLVRGMNGRTDESASDKHEVTRAQQEADRTLARSCPTASRPGTNSLGSCFWDAKRSSRTPSVTAF